MVRGLGGCTWPGRPSSLGPRDSVQRTGAGQEWADVVASAWHDPWLPPVTVCRWCPSTQRPHPSQNTCCEPGSHNLTCVLFLWAQEEGYLSHFISLCAQSDLVSTAVFALERSSTNREPTYAWRCPLLARPGCLCLSEDTPHAHSPTHRSPRVWRAPALRWPSRGCPP